MSLQKMRQAVQKGKLTKADREGFPRWLEQYAQFRRALQDHVIPVSRDSLIEFLKSLKRRGRQAWQRQQCVRAVQFYVRVSCQQPALAAELEDLHVRLGQLAEKELRAGRSEATQVVDEDLVGVIDPNEAELFQSCRRALRVRHYSRRTETAYVGWIDRFLRWSNLAEATQDVLLQEGPRKVGEFLTHLAVDGQVAASTQNQALSALLFLFRDLLQVELPALDAVRASKPKRLPVVLSRGEVQKLLAELDGRDLLIAQLLYGSGLRVMECLRLRIKDVRFDQHQIVVRDGKGGRISV
jgi:hypothetical protein